MKLYSYSIVLYLFSEKGRRRSTGTIIARKIPCSGVTVPAVDPDADDILTRFCMIKKIKK